MLILPDREYISYVDWRTLILLLCLMVVMAGLKEQGFFRYIGEVLLKRVKSPLGVAVVLIFLCFAGSMLITNDVALITFIPFGLLVLKMAKMEKSVCLMITLMTVAANLGSMLTPVGNPQNLYLYSASGMNMREFIMLMFPYTLTAALMLLITAGTAFDRRTEIFYSGGECREVKKGKVVYYGVLFLICLTCVMNLIRPEVLLLIILIAVFFENKELFIKIDYSLLATFIAFFIFIGNMGRFPVFTGLVSGLISGHEISASVLASQVISNVPAALLLSGFTDEWQKLIIGTNLGGLGTLIASMASLISYKQIVQAYPEKKMRYMAVFTAWNLIFLAVLYALSRLLLK